MYTPSSCAELRLRFKNVVSGSDSSVRMALSLWWPPLGPSKSWKKHIFPWDIWNFICHLVVTQSSKVGWETVNYVSRLSYRFVNENVKGDPIHNHLEYNTVELGNYKLLEKHVFFICMALNDIVTAQRGWWIEFYQLDSLSTIIFVSTHQQKDYTNSNVQPWVQFSSKEKKKLTSRELSQWQLSEFSKPCLRRLKRWVTFREQEWGECSGLHDSALGVETITRIK